MTFQFSYKYFDKNGKRKAGHLTATSFSEAKELLRTQGYVVISLTPTKIEKKTSIFSPRGKILKGSLLAAVTLQLSHLLKAGLPLYESLVSLAEQNREEFYHPLLVSLSERIKRGDSLSTALTAYPESFNPLYCAMVTAGESVGTLDTTLEKLAHLQEKQSRLKKQVISALIYPTLLLLFSGFVILVMLLFVIPSLQTLFEEQKGLNGVTRLVFGISTFLTTQWPYYLSCIAGLSLSLGAFAFKNRERRLPLKILLSLPLFKPLLLKTALSRYARTLGTLLHGGVPLLQALQISRKTLFNPFLEQVLEEAEKKIVEGSLLSVELKKSPLIPPLVPRLLAIGEESGNLAGMLNHLGELFDQDIEKILTRLLSLLQPLILIIMGAVIGAIMLAVLIPLTDVSAFI